MTIKLPQDVEMILKLLNDNEYEAYIVGGCVRDSLLNRIPHDWDICTSAKPYEIQEVFKNYRTIETGLKHGTLTVIVNNIPYEITTYRIEGNYSDNRHPDIVEFTTNLQDDLSRRDFTINAMAYNTKMGLIDPFDGLVDLRDEVINCVGNPRDRFMEDALRILRVFRFSSQLGFACDCNTSQWAMFYKKLLHNISIERITSELCKTIDSRNVEKVLSMYNEIYFEIIPELKTMYRFNQNNPYHIYSVWKHTIETLSCSSKDLVVKLALLFHDIGKSKCYSEDENGTGHFYKHAKIGAEITDSIMRRLKFDNKTREDVVELIGYHDAYVVANNKHIKRWLNRIGEIQFRRLLDIKEADIKAQNLEYINRIDEIYKTREILEVVLNEKQCFTMKNLAINGNDLMSIGYEQGKILGTVLKKLLECVITDEIGNNKDDLLTSAKEWLTQSNHTLI